MSVSDSVQRHRLIVALYEGGFEIHPSEPLPDIEPGEQCIVTCWPQQDVRICEVLVHDYQLRRITTTGLSIEVSRLKDYVRSQLHTCSFASAPIMVKAGERLTLTLVNDREVPLRPYGSTIVQMPEHSLDLDALEARVRFANENGGLLDFHVAAGPSVVFELIEHARKLAAQCARHERLKAELLADYAAKVKRLKNTIRVGLVSATLSGTALLGDDEDQLAKKAIAIADAAIKQITRDV